MSERFGEDVNEFRPIWAGVGVVASAYGGVEASLRQLLWVLLGESSRARTVSEKLNTGIVMSLCRHIFKIDTELAYLSSFALWVLRAAEIAGEDRAKVAHGSWSITQTIGPQLEWHGTRADP